MSRTSVSNRLSLRNFGKCLQFNGGSTFLTCPIAPSTTGFNCAFWLNADRITSQRRVVTWTAAGPTGGFTFEFPSANAQFTWSGRNNSNVEWDLKASMTPGAWYHVVGTFKPNEVKLYINGALVASDTSCTMSVAASQTLTIGRSSAAAAAFLLGRMDQFIFHNTDTPWTQQQIEDLYYRGTIPNGVDVVYEMNDDILDSSGNANHGTLTSGSYSPNVVMQPRSALVEARSAANRQSIFGSNGFDRLRGWNYSSNYLNGSSTNPWYVETNQLPHDLADIAAAGMNVVKIYADENNAAAHLAALDQVAAAGLKAIVLKFIVYNRDYSHNTGYSNRTSAIAGFATMVNNLKSHPAVIGWGFGNENNYNLGSVTTLYDWYTMLEEAIRAGKDIDTSRFYFTANGEISKVAYADSLVSSIDVWGINVYRGTTFSTLVSEIQAATAKSVILTEFGRKRPDNTTQNQQTQASEVITLIHEVEEAFPTIRGWIHFKFTHTRVTDTGDEFWEATLPLSQGTYQNRTKMAEYNAMKAYCSTYSYGEGAI